MPRFHNRDNIRIQFTAEEETKRDAEEQEWFDGAFARAIAELRNKRNRLLAETDFYGLSDRTLSEDMTTYRQALRDLTEGISTEEAAANVVYPTKP